MKGSHRRDVVSQAELGEMEQAQLAEWHATKQAALLSENIKSRIEHGAEVEDGPLYFDQKSELVRTRKKAGGE